MSCINDAAICIYFGRSRAPGKGSAAGRKFLAPPYYSQRAVFASPLSAFFHRTMRCCLTYVIVGHGDGGENLPTRILGPADRQRVYYGVH